jgi:hypothetical protein
LSTCVSGEVALCTMTPSTWSRRIGSGMPVFSSIFPASSANWPASTMFSAEVSPETMKRRSAL